MDIKRRDGSVHPFSKDKLVNLFEKLSESLGNAVPRLPNVQASRLADKVRAGLYSGVTSEQLLELSAETSATMTTIHPEYSDLAARISMHWLHKVTSPDFLYVTKALYNYKHHKTGRLTPLVARETLDIVQEFESQLTKTIDYSRDYSYNYFGLKTLMRAYLLKGDDGKIIERPQHMIMRISVGIHGWTSLDRIIETYYYMSLKFFTHGSPTLFNAGTPNPQMSSCFLTGIQDDSIEGIFATLQQCAVISKCAGGIGLHIHNIRATGSYIAGSNGSSNGIVPMLRVFNNMARYVDQGGNKRPGAIAVYLEPWHADIFEFLDLKKNHGKEELRARDLFYALWIPDLFMQKVKDDSEWCLFSPDEAPDLYEVYGKEFDALYNKYESMNRQVRKIKARSLWRAILHSQIETGTPFMLYKDACNSKSNQKNLGTIKSSNLCTEIIQYSSADEIAVCNLASLALPMFVEEREQGPEADSNQRSFFNFSKLHLVTKIVARNLNRIIDVNYYPLEEAATSNLKHRPISIGVQGLADAIFKLRLPSYDCAEARKLNSQIFETIYHAALEMSIELAISDGTYESYKGSPASKGILQFDMWEPKQPPSDLWDWEALKLNLTKYGLRNSLLVGPMPTASTSQILGFSECFEPYTSNIYTRRVLSGEFQVVNRYLVQDLMNQGIWNEQLKNEIIKRNGSVQGIDIIPEKIQQRYRTVWEMSQKSLIDMAADRARYIDQSQSLNIYFENPSMQKLTSMHFYAWQKGLKTGMYYLRTKAAAHPQQVTVVDEEGAIFKQQTTDNRSVSSALPRNLKRRRLDEVNNKENNSNNQKPQPHLATISRTRSCTQETCDVCSG